MRKRIVNRRLNYQNSPYVALLRWICQHDSKIILARESSSDVEVMYKKRKKKKLRKFILDPAIVAANI